VSAKSQRLPPARPAPSDPFDSGEAIFALSRVGELPLLLELPQEADVLELLLP